MESNRRTMRLSLAVALGFCLLLTSRVHGRSDGAPAHTCEDLMPQHGKDPQNSPSPYQLLPSKGQGRIRLILGSPQGDGYEGFLILAKDVDTGEVIGEFNNLPVGDARHVECTPNKKNGVTHVQPRKIHNLEIDWEAPADYEGTIVFNSTICKTWDVFWVGVESPRISVVKRSIDIHSTPPSITFPRAPTTPPYYNPTTENLESRVIDPFYDGCGLTKNCLGFPSGCVDKQNCDVMTSVLVEGERYIFEVKSRNSDSKYMSVALSEDDKMGDDSVVDCIRHNDDSVKIQMSWNYRRSNTKVNTPPGAIEELSSSYRDGVLSCKFSRNKITTIQGQQFDLVTKPYHLLLASGSSLKNQSVGFHDVDKIASGEPKLLSDVGTLKAASDLLIRIHGGLMLASWIGTASVGMLLARYFRQTWVASQLCGKDQWFAWHRFFMFLTWSMTIGGFVVIFVQLEAWSSETYHASLGLATTILCFIQPFMAAMRPHPGAPRRLLFNWVHWFVGNAAHICGIVAIFFAVRLAKAKLPEWVDWVLVAYVVFHVLTHLFLTFAGCASDKQGSQRVNSFPMKDVHARNSMTHPDARRDAPHAGLRKLTFGLYFVVIALFTAALILIAVFAPIEDSWNILMEEIKNH